MESHSRIPTYSSLHCAAEGAHQGEFLLLLIYHYLLLVLLYIGSTVVVVVIDVQGQSCFQTARLPIYTYTSVYYTVMRPLILRVKRSRTFFAGWARRTLNTGDVGRESYVPAYQGAKEAKEAKETVTMPVVAIRRHRALVWQRPFWPETDL
ncbi:hypothetical protein GGR50DRAFT_582511 [Xylaria sp. CBS 124048]|nr:hypothetical protein GGR50DRAFT_582511 [Xylaria sp. CBS 124048]